MSDVQTTDVSKSELYWFHIDETNASVKDGEFFIVGGLVLTGEQIIKADLVWSSSETVLAFDPLTLSSFIPDHVRRKSAQMTSSEPKSLRSAFSSHLGSR